MSSIAITVSIDDKSVGARLAQFERELKDRSGLNEAVGKRAMDITRRRFLDLERYQHKTAGNLGATPTHHFQKAATNTSFTADQNKATVTVKSPGITRALRDISIVPTDGRKWLTIPTAGIAYGRTASQIAGQFGPLFRPYKKGLKKTRANALAAKVDGKLKFFFALVRRVIQRQDRSLLPSDQAYRDAAIKGARDYLDVVLFWSKGTTV